MIEKEKVKEKLIVIRIIVLTARISYHSSLTCFVEPYQPTKISTSGGRVAPLESRSSEHRDE